MTRAEERQIATLDILALVPPRGTETAVALANLDRLDEAALEAMGARLEASGRTFGSEPRHRAQAGGRRGAGARAKLASGLAKLLEATRLLDDRDEERRRGPGT